MVTLMGMVLGWCDGGDLVGVVVGGRRAGRLVGRYIDLSVGLLVGRSVGPSVRPSIYLSVYLPFRPSIWSICMDAYLSNRPLIRLSLPGCSRSQVIGSYEDRIRNFSSAERVFEFFASVTNDR